MAARVYFVLCLLAAVAGSGLYLGGLFSAAVTMIFGFIISVLARAALLVVFPAMLSEGVRH